MTVSGQTSRASSGYGTGEGAVGLADNEDGTAVCEVCGEHAVLYFADSAQENMHYVCLAHAGAVAYDVAVASTRGRPRGGE